MFGNNSRKVLAWRAQSTRAESEMKMPVVRTSVRDLNAKKPKRRTCALRDHRLKCVFSLKRPITRTICSKLFYSNITTVFNVLCLVMLASYNRPPARPDALNFMVQNVQS